LYEKKIGSHLVLQALKLFFYICCCKHFNNSFWLFVQPTSLSVKLPLFSFLSIRYKRKKEKAILNILWDLTLLRITVEVRKKNGKKYLE
jgi:hypothetical protein